VVEDGDPAGQPILVHNGMPNSRLLYPPSVELARRQGVRMISYDRPGYGGSDPKPGRPIADGAADVEDIAASLEISRLGVWGISGGGPYALACAALLPELVPAVGVLASIAPYPAEGLDYFEGMGEMNVEDVQLMLRDPEAAAAKLAMERVEMMAAKPEDLYEVILTLLSPADAAVFTGELAEFFSAMTNDGLAPGIDGWMEDANAHLIDWGFDLSSITTPVLLLHGRQDRFVPFQHGQWLAKHVPGVEAWLTEDDGHLTLTENHLEAVHEWLLERL
jgi:pimeloyl-ACP methyl ester carboxylesterase